MRTFNKNHIKLLKKFEKKQEVVKPKETKKKDKNK